MGNNLERCPFCNNEAHISTEYEIDGSDCIWKFVMCSKCGARTRGKWFSTGNDCPIFYQEVRDKWNERHSSIEDYLSELKESLVEKDKYIKQLEAQISRDRESLIKEGER